MKRKSDIMKIGRMNTALLLMAAIVFSTGCQKIFDIKPKDTLDQSQMYQNVFDADAAVLGIYGKFMKLADRYIILNELRADLVDCTPNADEHLRQISTHAVGLDNPYASPKPFYELILNCNDVLENFQKMKAENRMTELEFNQRYSDIGALRSFIYLQLGIHFGRVPYVTGVLKNVDEVKNPTTYPVVGFDALLDSLINFTEKLPFKELYPVGSNLNITVDGYQTQKFFVNKKVILGDLYLWKGNFQNAAIYYREVMETGTQGVVNGQYYSLYKVGWDSNGDVDHYISYSRAGDASTLIQNTQWRIMFEQPFGSSGFDREWVWALPFDSKFNPENPLIRLFSPIGGSYLLRPSQLITDMWNAETQRPAQGGSIPYDARGLLSIKQIGGQPVAMKYLYNYLNFNSLLPVNPLAKTGKWFLFRQTHLHMRFSEAANRSRKHRLAWGFLNSGITGAFPAPTSNVTNFHNTLSEAYPFNFDARNSGSTGVPFYRADWYRNIGIRSRANLVDLTVPANDSMLNIETNLIKETALENAFEGTRWPDLLRIAIRRNDPAFIADRVFNKLTRSGVSAGAASTARAKLLARDWYLPFKW